MDPERRTNDGCESTAISERGTKGKWRSFGKAAAILAWSTRGSGVVPAGEDEAKRLEQGRFARLWSESESTVQLTMNELQLFVEGSKRCFRRLLLVIRTHPLATKALVLHLMRAEGYELQFGL